VGVGGVWVFGFFFGVCVASSVWFEEGVVVFLGSSWVVVLCGDCFFVFFGGGPHVVSLVEVLMGCFFFLCYCFFLFAFSFFFFVVFCCFLTLLTPPFLSKRASLREPPLLGVFSLPLPYGFLHGYMAETSPNGRMMV